MRSLILKSLNLLTLAGSLVVFSQIAEVHTTQAAPTKSSARVSLKRSGSPNYVLNPSGEINTRNVTVTDATIARDTDAADSLDGISSFVCDASAQNGYCEFTLDTIAEGDKTGNCEFKGKFKGDGTLYKAQITDGTNVLNSTTTLGSVTDWTDFTLNYPCGATRTVRITQTESGTAPALNVGRLYYGRATNIGRVSQAVKVGSITWTATPNCTWTSTSTSYVNVTDNDCDDNARVVEGSITDATSGVRPAFGVNLTKGEYVVYVSGFMGVVANAATTDMSAYFRLYDGTTVRGTDSRINGGGSSSTGLTNIIFGTQFNFTVTSDEGLKTIDLQTKVAGTNPLSVIASNDVSMKIAVYRFPSASEVAVRANNTAVVFSGNKTSTQSVTADVTNITYATVKDPFGAWDGDEFVVPINGAGDYQVSAASRDNSVATSSRTDVYLNGTLFGGVAFSQQGAAAPSGYVIMPNLVAGDRISFRNNQNLTLAAQGRVSISGISATGTPHPVIINSVTSGSAGAERIERATVNAACTAGPCTISSQSGNWLTSITRSTTGTYGVNIAAGVFSGAPMCQVVSGQSQVGLSTYPTTSGFDFLVRNSGGSLADGGFHIMCMGPR